MVLPKLNLLYSSFQHFSQGRLIQGLSLREARAEMILPNPQLNLLSEAPCSLFQRISHPCLAGRGGQTNESAPKSRLRLRLNRTLGCDLQILGTLCRNDEKPLQAGLWVFPPTLLPRSGLGRLRGRTGGRAGARVLPGPRVGADKEAEGRRGAGADSGGRAGRAGAAAERGEEPRGVFSWRRAPARPRGGGGASRSPPPRADEPGGGRRRPRRLLLLQ